MKCKYCGQVLEKNYMYCPSCEKAIEIENVTHSKKNNNGILILIIILLLGVIGGGYYYVTRPDVVFNLFINNLYEKAVVLGDKNKQTKIDFDFNFDIDAGSEYKEITDLIKELKFKSSVNTDLENQKALFAFNIDYKNNTLLSTDLYYNKNTLYIDLKDIFNKLIKYELEEEIEDLNINEEDINIILNNIFNALKEALKEATYLSKSEKDINKYILVIDNENKNMMYNKFVDYLLNSNDFIDTISKVNEKDKEEVIQMLTESKEELNDLEEEIHVSIYTRMLTNDFIKLEVGTKDESYITFIKNDDKTYKLETKSIGDTSAIVTVTTDNNKTTLVYDINSKDIKAKATFNMIYMDNESINIPETKESVLFSELTEDDTTKILETLMNNDDIKEIVESFDSLLSKEEEDNDTEDFDEKELRSHLNITLIETAKEIENLYSNNPFEKTGVCKKEWGNLNTIEYETCTYEFDENGEVTIWLKGKGKYAKYENCEGTSSGAGCSW